MLDPRRQRLIAIVLLVASLLSLAAGAAMRDVGLSLGAVAGIIGSALLFVDAGQQRVPGQPARERTAALILGAMGLVAIVAADVLAASNWVRLWLGVAVLTAVLAAMLIVRSRPG